MEDSHQVPPNERIEDLANQLLAAQQQQDTETIESIIQELDKENTVLQEKKKIFVQSLNVEGKTN